MPAATLQTMEALVQQHVGFFKHVMEVSPFEEDVQFQIAVVKPDIVNEAQMQYVIKVEDSSQNNALCAVSYDEGTQTLEFAVIEPYAEGTPARIVQGSVSTAHETWAWNEQNIDPTWTDSSAEQVFQPVLTGLDYHNVGTGHLVENHIDQVGNGYREVSVAKVDRLVQEHGRFFKSVMGVHDGVQFQIAALPQDPHVDFDFIIRNTENNDFVTVRFNEETQSLHIAAIDSSMSMVLGNVNTAVDDAWAFQPEDAWKTVPAADAPTLEKFRTSLAYHTVEQGLGGRMDREEPVSNPVEQGLERVEETVKEKVQTAKEAWIVIRRD